MSGLKISSYLSDSHNGRPSCSPEGHWLGGVRWAGSTQPEGHVQRTEDSQWCRRCQVSFTSKTGIRKSASVLLHRTPFLSDALWENTSVCNVSGQLRLSVHSSPDWNARKTIACKYRDFHSAHWDLYFYLDLSHAFSCVDDGLKSVFTNLLSWFKYLIKFWLFFFQNSFTKQRCYVFCVSHQAPAMRIHLAVN